MTEASHVALKKPLAEDGSIKEPCLWVLKENLRKTIEEELVGFHSALKFLSENKWWFYKVVTCWLLFYQLTWTFCHPSVLLDAAFASLCVFAFLHLILKWYLEPQILGSNTDWWGAKQAVLFNLHMLSFLFSLVSVLPVFVFERAWGCVLVLDIRFILSRAALASLHRNSSVL